MCVRESPRQIQIKSSASPVIAHCRTGRRSGGSSLQAIRASYRLYRSSIPWDYTRAERRLSRAKSQLNTVWQLCLSEMFIKSGIELSTARRKRIPCPPRSLLHRYPAGASNAHTAGRFRSPESPALRARGEVNTPPPGTYTFKDNGSLCRLNHQRGTRTTRRQPCTSSLERPVQWMRPERGRKDQPERPSKPGSYSRDLPAGGAGGRRKGRANGGRAAPARTPKEEWFCS